MCSPACGWVCVCAWKNSVCASFSFSPSMSSFHHHIPPNFVPAHLLSTRACPPPPLILFIALSRAALFVLLDHRHTHTTWGEMCYNLPVGPLLVKHTVTTVSASDGLAALERHVHVAVAALVVDGAGCGVDGAGGLVGGRGLLGLVG